MKAAIMGYGTVGSGVYEVLTKNAESIAAKLGQELKVKYVLDLREFPGDPVMEVLTHDYNEILNDDEIEVVAEVMGGLKPAYDFTRKLLEAGKSVCTSNKELVAAHGAELLEIAEAHNANYLFEASVGGGIPILRPLNSSLTADVIMEMSGILNGTTNYMLTKMAGEGLDYDDVLKEAQAMGYAELHPEADVEGWDPCRKIAILTSLASGKQVDYTDIYTEGITKITTEDFAYAKKMDCSIKLVASSKRVGDTYCAMVSPVMIPSSHPLYMVNGVFNAIFVVGNMLGDSMFYGSGAGKLPTASAVAGDMVDAARNQGRHIPQIWSREKLALAPVSEMSRRFFVRTKDAAKAAEVFGNIELVDAGIAGETGFITPQMTEGEYAEAAKSLDVISMIRM